MSDPLVQLQPSFLAKSRTRSVRETLGGVGIPLIAMLTWSPHSSHLMTLPSTVIFVAPLAYPSEAFLGIDASAVP